MEAVPLPVVAVLIAALLGGGTAVIAVSACVRRLRRVAADCDPEKPPPSPPSKGEPRSFSWGEIGRMTAGFEAPVVGRGGYSVVYLGGLEKEGVVAVKVHRESERLHRAFERELDVLRKVRHPNVVELIGFCDGKEEGGALIMEYVPNGTLHDKLHGNPEFVLPWSTRMSIVHSLASVVSHLHTSSLPILHNDLKPSNVLLTSTLCPILCDFGSATVGFSSSLLAPRSGLVGSPGYSDPNYLRSGMPSKSTDVYSFGVLLLEIVSGKEAFCEETGTLVMAVRGLLRERKVGELVDGRLGGDYDIKEAEVVVALVERCVGEQPGIRPSMTEIVIELEKVVGSSIASSIRTDDVDLDKEFSKE